MCNYRRWTLSLAVPVMMVAYVQAAEFVLPEVETAELLMLRQHSVQQDLKVGKAESTAIKDFTHSQHMKAIQAHKLNERERNQKFDQLAKENEEFLKKTLTPAQADRLRQISMQRASLLWVTHPEIAKKLNLDAKQLETAKADQQKARHETDAALTAKTPADRDKKLHELKTVCEKRMMDLLNPEQEAKWKEMVGAPFEGEFTYEDSAT